MTPPDHVGDDPVPHAGGGSQGLSTARLTGLLNSTYASKPRTGTTAVGQNELLISVKDYGAKGDLVTGLLDAAVVAGVAQVTSPSMTFTAADVGKLIDVYGCGAAVAAPTLTLTTASTGGSLTPGTYSYRATVVTAAGESLPGQAVSITVGAGTNTNIVKVLVNPPPGAGTGATMNIYGRTSGSEQLIASNLPTLVHYGADSFVDTGAATPAGALPSSDSSSGTLSTVITGVASPHTATVQTAPSRTASSLAWQYGSNDGPSIAAAQTAASKATVYLPSGNYLTDRVFTVSANQHWLGAGRYNTTIKVQEPGQAGGTPARIFDFQGIQRSSVRSLTLDGARGTAPNNFGNLIRLGSARSIVLEDLRMQNAPSRNAAIQATDSWRVHVQNFEIDSCGYGVVLGSTSGSSGDSSRCKVTRGSIENSDYNAIYLSGDIGSNPNPNQIYRHAVSDLTIRGFYDTAVEIGQGCNGCSVSDVNIDGQGYGSNGILIRDNIGTRVTGFTITNITPTTTSGSAGINLLPQYLTSISRPVIANGTIDTCGIGVIGNYVYSGQVANVTVSACSTYGWNLQNFQFSAFTNCMAYHCGYHGWLLGASGFATQACTFASCAGIGNSQAATGTYYGFHIDVSANFLTFSACIGSDDQASGSRTQVFGFNYVGSNCFIEPSCVGFQNTSAPFAGSSLRGIRAGGQQLFPQPLNSGAALPTAGATYRNLIFILNGNGTSTADTAYVCLQSATGTYSWKTLATG